MPSERDYEILLEDIARSEARIAAVLYTDLAGVLISMVTRTATEPSKPSEATQLHAFLGSAIAQSVAEMGNQYSLNPLHIVFVEYKQGTLLLAPTGSGVIIVLADPGANLGLIRFRISKVTGNLQSLEKQRESARTPVVTRSPLISIPEAQKSSQSIDYQPSKDKKNPSSEQDFLKQALAALDDI